MFWPARTDSDQSDIYVDHRPMVWRGIGTEQGSAAIRADAGLWASPRRLGSPVKLGNSLRFSEPLQ